MLTELEQSANNEARHAHRELVEVELRNMALDYLAAAGQAAEAYQAQLAAEAKLEKAVEALEHAKLNMQHPDQMIDDTLAELKGDSQ